jgi:hypothetical protein
MRRLNGMWRKHVPERATAQGGRLRRPSHHCERSEAIQNAAKGWIASSQELLAMTNEDPRRWRHPPGGSRSIAAPQANGGVEFPAMPRYIASMSPAVKTILELMASWPVEDQEELSELAREIEARRTGVYRLSDEERATIDAARRGPLAADDEVEAFWKHRGLA